ncbi:hypothetical protein [Halobacillus massiliensis]|uniref:hypothetical protein n=1 Tax=Halobacillus massiliensis TaxID=1926286 RepID=UPI0009E2CB7D|nr:hypothetical protein [Halobacillus massiliensis]
MGENKTELSKTEKRKDIARLLYILVFILLSPFLTSTFHPLIALTIVLGLYPLLMSIIEEITKE